MRYGDQRGERAEGGFPRTRGAPASAAAAERLRERRGGVVEEREEEPCHDVERRDVAQRTRHGTHPGGHVVSDERERAPLP